MDVETIIIIVASIFALEVFLFAFIAIRRRLQKRSREKKEQNIALANQMVASKENFSAPQQNAPSQVVEIQDTTYMEDTIPKESLVYKIPGKIKTFATDSSGKKIIGIEIGEAPPNMKFDQNVSVIREIIERVPMAKTLEKPPKLEEEPVTGDPLEATILRLQKQAKAGKSPQEIKSKPRAKKAKKNARKKHR